jgi:hypothetical protein
VVVENKGSFMRSSGSGIINDDKKLCEMLFDSPALRRVS